MDKSEIRKLGKASRKQIVGETRNAYQQSICNRIRNREEYQKATKILSYQAFGGEVSLELLNEWAVADGKQLAYPYCTDKTTMIALVPQGEESWGEDLYGIRVPMPEKSIEMKPEEVELVLTPLVAFDENCNRTGMGAGVYDRYLPKCKHADFIGIAFEAQKMPEIPTEQYDVTLKGIATEVTIYRSK